MNLVAEILYGIFAGAIAFVLLALSVAVLVFVVTAVKQEYQDRRHK